MHHYSRLWVFFGFVFKFQLGLLPTEQKKLFDILHLIKLKFASFYCTLMSGKEPVPNF